MKIKADLHVHTALSPCGSLDMSPSLVVDLAMACGLDVIAVTDHNAVENSFYTAEVAEKKGLTVIYGMEAQTEEEVHILCFFLDRPQTEKFYQDIYTNLPDLKNNPEFFGDQVVVNAADDVLRFEERTLMNSLTLSIGDLVEKVKRYNGFIIPSHIASQPFGLMVNLGFVPMELRDSVMEIRFRRSYTEVCDMYPELVNFPYVYNSDAHYPEDMGSAYTEYEIKKGTSILPGIFESIREGRFKRFKR